MSKSGILYLFCAVWGAWAFSGLEKTPPQKLSEYGFFKNKLSDLIPAEGVFPYEVNAPLFSDYAEKARFVYLPKGKSMTFSDKGAFECPEGAVLIKNFYYHTPKWPRQLIETRLLLRVENGWKALTYVWDEQQTDATLEVAGAEIELEWLDEGQKTKRLAYQVPNQNQCKSCHSYDGQFTPLGLTARQLHRDGASAVSPLQDWVQQGLLTLPEGASLDQVHPFPDYRKPETPTEQAARAYLEGNCAHCHNPHGPASTSGMFLHFDEQNPERLGVGKAPVAAGRGSGNRKYGIVPGKPDQSILLFRMESNDPGIRMPETGRQTAHKEGIALIKKWIREMP